MIDIKPCRGCGRPLIHHRVANLDVRLEPTPLGAQEAVGEIIAQRSLWVVDQGKVRPARPGEAGPLREHRCTAASRPNPAPSVPAPPKAPQSPSGGRVAPSTQSSGPSTDHSGARSAGPLLSERSHHEGDRLRRQPCDVCRKPVMMDGSETYVALELGATIMWACHDECTRRKA